MVTCAWPQVSWQGHDAGGHPVLVVRIGEAIASCDKERGAHFANAIITQVRYGSSRAVFPFARMRSRLSSKIIRFHVVYCEPRSRSDGVHGPRKRLCDYFWSRKS